MSSDNTASESAEAPDQPTTEPGAEQPTVDPGAEPSTEQEPGEEPKAAASDDQPEPSHEAVGVGVIEEPPPGE